MMDSEKCNEKRDDFLHWWSEMGIRLAKMLREADGKPTPLMQYVQEKHEPLGCTKVFDEKIKKVRKP